MNTPSRRSLFALLTFTLFATACTSVPPDGVESNDNAPDLTPPADLPDIHNERLRAVNDWAYQLQGEPLLDLDPIRQSVFDLVVVDYSADGGEDGEFTAEQISALQNDSDNPKIVLAYMSIGEAEIGRFYFDNAWVSPDPDHDPDGPFTLTDAAPSFLAPPNPDFPDNFKVRYWRDDWRQIIITNPGSHAVIKDAKSYLDRIIDAGFDGVYLDIIDAFEFFGPPDLTDGNGERVDAASLMIDFVIAIADHARNTRGCLDFLVFPQNGANIIDDDSFPPGTIPENLSQEQYATLRRIEYFTAIDGIGAEDSFYFGNDDENNPFDPQDHIIESLDTFRQAGLCVLSIDYLTDTTKIDDFYDRARRQGWVPYASVRDLSRLVINQTQPPD